MTHADPVLNGKIKVDTDVIAEWRITRQGEITSLDQVCNYHCVYTLFTAFPPRTMKFDIQHRYSDGGTKLLLKMLGHVAQVEDSGAAVAQAGVS